MDESEIWVYKGDRYTSIPFGPDEEIKPGTLVYHIHSDELFRAEWTYYKDKMYVVDIYTNKGCFLSTKSLRKVIRC